MKPSEELKTVYLVRASGPERPESSQKQSSFERAKACMALRSLLATGGAACRVHGERPPVQEMQCDSLFGPSWSLEELRPSDLRSF